MPTLTDQEHKREITARVTALNDAIRAAALDGLTLTLWAQETADANRCTGPAVTFNMHRITKI